MRTTSVVVAGFISFGLLVWTGCERAPKTIPLSAAEIKAAGEFFGGNLHFSAVQLSTRLDPAAPDHAASFTNKERISFSEGNLREEHGSDTLTLTQIFRPDRKTVYVLWPIDKVMLVLDSEALGEMTGMSFSSWETPTGYVVKEKADLGEESLNGRRCVKCKVVTGDAEWTTWEAIDLNRFPVRAERFIQIPLENGIQTNILRLEFTNVRLRPPAASLFEPPGGYKKFTSMENAMEYMLKRRAKQIERSL